ncbi:Nascent polypeptide-associated complex subunit alpha, partial [Galemys pyrenaicus]
TVPALKQELPQPQAEKGSGTESDSDESVPASRNRIPHRQPHSKLSWQQQLRSMKSQPAKQNRAGYRIYWSHHLAIYEYPLCHHKITCLQEPRF